MSLYRCFSRHTHTHTHTQIGFVSLLKIKPSLYLLFLFLLGARLARPQPILAQSTLASLTQGQIIQIAPNSGAYMCSDQNCSGNGAAAEPYKLMYSGLSDGATRGFIMVDNYCAWRSANCTAHDGTKYWYGTSWNGDGTTNTTGSATGFHNDIGGSRKSINVLQQLENFYNSLPTTIGGVAKTTAISSRSFDMSAVNYITGITYKACNITANSTAFGNIGATFGSSGCTMTSRVSLPSYEEWQGSLVGYSTYPPSGTLGYAFCQARFNASGCNAVSGTDLANGTSLSQYTFFNANNVLKRPYFPWLRSPSLGSAANVFYVFHFSFSDSLSRGNASSSLGVLPWLYFQSSIPISSGAGTYASPYSLWSNTTPTLSLTNPIASANLNSATVTVSGTVTDPDAQTLTIRYNLNTTTNNGTLTGGSQLTTSASPNSGKAFSTNITTTANASNTLHVWVCDGVECSAVISRTFIVDTTNPTFTLSPSPTGTSSWTTSTSLTITPADTGGSGVAETRYSTTNNLNSTCTSGGSVYSAAISLNPAIINSIYVCVRDNAGNVSTSASAYNTANVYQVNKDPDISPTLGTLGTLTQGQIIQIEPVSGTYMCGAQICTSDGAPAEPYKLMYSGLSDATTRGFIMVDNYCAWRSADCTYYDGTKYWYGTSWNGDGTFSTTGSAIGCHHDLGGSRKSINILQQLENFYNSLPATIGGVAKATAIPTRSFDMSPLPFNPGTSAISKGACNTTTNATAYGNIQATFNGDFCTMTSRVSLPSYEEWLGGLYGHSYYPPSGTLGYAFCLARYGSAGCNATGSTVDGIATTAANKFNQTAYLKRPYHPSLRSPLSGDSAHVFRVYALDMTYSLDRSNSFNYYGVLPWLYIDSSLGIADGSGTYVDPYTLTLANPTLENSTPNIGAYASYVSGFNSLVLAGSAKDEDIGQTLTIQYQIDGTSGTWSNLTTVVADGTNQNWSGVVTLPVGLTDGTHTVYVRVYDGYGYSGNKTASFYLDDIPPANTASLVGGVLCTGIPTIYCTAPTGISLTSSDLTIGLDAYRTQWDTTFASGDVSPTWTSGTPPSSISTTGHTTSGQTHTLYYQTRDKVGNVSVVESISYYINHTPEISLSGTSHDQVVTPYTPLVLSGTFTDLDPTQTVTVKATINGIDYVSQTYPTTTGTVSWEIVIPFSSLQSLSPPQLTNLPLVVTDSAGVSSSTYYTGQITLSSSTSSEIYLSVIQNIPFSLTIGKVGAFNITFGTNQGITVAHNSSDEIIVSGSLSSPVSIPFGITTLVFTILDEPSTQVQQIEFV